MAVWVNTAIRFNDASRFMVFLIPSRFAPELIGLLHKLTGYDQPDELCAAVKQIVTKARPELVDGMLCHIEMDYRRGAFAATVAHPSFKPVPFGEEVPTAGTGHDRPCSAAGPCRDDRQTNGVLQVNFARNNRLAECSREHPLYSREQPPHSFANP